MMKGLTTCSQCGQTTETEQASYGMFAYTCVHCGHEDIERRKPLPPQMTLPGIRKTVQAVEPEKNIQEKIVTALRNHGYLVLKTTVQYQFSPCMHCGRKTRPMGGTGQSFGIPDLYVRHPEWEPYRWVGMEVKGAKTILSPAQKELEAMGAVVIVRSVQEALAVFESKE